MPHIIYFDHKVNPCNGCTIRQVPLHMIPNFLTLTPGGHVIDIVDVDVMIISIDE